MESKDAPIFSGERESFVACQDGQGLALQATLLRFSRYQVAFEIYSPTIVLHMSEALKEFKIVLQDRTVYSGRAVVTSLVHVGPALVCEATLDESWLDLQPLLPDRDKPLSVEFGKFLQGWQKSYRVLPEFKVVVADMQSLFSDMRLWLEQVELGLRAVPNGDWAARERNAAAELAPPVLSAIDALGDRFEEIAGQLTPELRGAHIHFTRRHLHSLLLCSPFSYRTYSKPLGYAGDYEMVNMIIRNPYEGESLFAKVVNAWFLTQLPAQAHRNRITILKERLVTECARMARLGRAAQIFNLGCGPAGEIQEFLAEESICDNAHFTLLDFNEETIQNTSNLLQGIAKKHSRRAQIKMVQRSVQQVLKDAMRSGPGPADGKYDFLYCAGLFDYLPDRVCKQLMNVFHRWLAPGGLLLATNVDGTRPFHNKLEFILDWHLIYRNGGQMMSLKPDEASPDACVVQSDLTAVNLFLEVRKPLHEYRNLGK